jgi:serine/threonine-protein kinase
MRAVQDDERTPEPTEESGVQAKTLTAKTLAVGDVVGKKYRIVRKIGGGASANVWEAEHKLIGSHVAIKVVHSDLSRRDEMLDRFEQEARICGTIRSPYLPQVYDVGHLDDEAPYMVMEMLDGETLESKLGGGPIPIPTVVEIGRQLMAALVDIHRAGVIHRDVKPDNIILHNAGGVTILKLVDFGVCKPTLSNRAITMEGMVVGTPHYMSPEQVRGDELDPRSDIYAAGVVLYEAITGKPPFTGEGLGDIAASILRDPVVPPSIRREECPRMLEQIVQRAMSRDREQRFAGAKEMARELGAVVRQYQYPTGIAAWALSPPRGFVAPRPTRPSRDEETARFAVRRESIPSPTPAGERSLQVGEVSNGSETRRGPRLLRESEMDPVTVPVRRRWPLVAVAAVGVLAAIGGLGFVIGGVSSVEGSEARRDAIGRTEEPAPPGSAEIPVEGPVASVVQPPLPIPAVVAPVTAAVPEPTTSPSPSPTTTTTTPTPTATPTPTPTPTRGVVAGRGRDRQRAPAPQRAAARAEEPPPTTIMDAVGDARRDLEALRRMEDLGPEAPVAPVAPVPIGEQPQAPAAPPPSDNPYDEPPASAAPPPAPAPEPVPENPYDEPAAPPAPPPPETPDNPY